MFKKLIASMLGAFLLVTLTPQTAMATEPASSVTAIKTAATSAAQAQKAAKKVVHRSRLLGAYSRTWNKFKQGHVYELHTYVKDTIQDHHYCAYVEYYLQFKISLYALGETGWLYGDHPYRVSTCDEDWTEVRDFDVDSALTTFVNVTKIRLKVYTCEDNRYWRNDRCTYYYTKVRSL